MTSELRRPIPSVGRSPTGSALSPDRRRIRILLICCLSLFIVGVDITAVNVALPSIGRQLHASVSGLQWTVDAYTVVLASLLTLSGSTADRLGRKRTFMVGLAVFALASAMCSVAPSVGVLVAFRILQAVGGSMLNPVAMAIIANTFTDPRERAQAVGVWGAVFGVSMALGPVLGGALVSTVGWRAIFWINVPVGLAAIVLTLVFVPESRAPVPRRVDPVGQVAVTVLLAGLTYGIIEGPNRGWSSAPVLVSLLASGLALAVLLVYERRRREALIDVRFFRSFPFSAAIVISIAAFAAFGGFLFLDTLYLQSARGLSPVDAGLLTAPLALMTVVASPLAGRVVGRRGPRIPLLIAGTGLTLGCLGLIGLTAHTSIALLVASYLIFGFGFGSVNAPITNAAVSGMPRAQAGTASAIATTSRQVGQTLGVAVVGALVATSVGGADRGLPAATHAAWWVLAGAGVLIVGLGLAATGGRARESARRTAEELNPEALTA